jgi:peptidoglycan/xylan/chitin deacetylase (PgdA/CDA1 family)
MHFLLLLALLSNSTASSQNRAQHIPCETRTILGRSHKLCWTFDDHPHPNTPQVLNLLSLYKIRATFFIVGWPLWFFHRSPTTPSYKQYLRWLQAIQAKGHVFGNHSVSHANLCTKSLKVIRWEINLTQRLMLKYLRVRVKLWRPPHAILCLKVQRVAAQHGLTTIMFDVCDWRTSAQRMWKLIRARVLRGKTSTVLLLHHKPRRLRQLLQLLAKHP